MVGFVAEEAASLLREVASFIGAPTRPRLVGGLVQASHADMAAIATLSVSPFLILALVQGDRG